MPTRSQRKGKRIEYLVRNHFRKLGRCERVPCSGNARAFKGDLIFIYKGDTYKVEVKSRSDGFKNFYKWLEKVDILVVKADQKPPLVILPFDTFHKLLSK
jgi:Holliday junction resolvase